MYGRSREILYEGVVMPPPSGGEPVRAIQMEDCAIIKCAARISGCRFGLSCVTQLETENDGHIQPRIIIVVHPNSLVRYDP